MKVVKFVQIAASNDVCYALDEKGRVWFYDYGTWRPLGEAVEVD
jgi:hypothetical protein